MDSWIDNSESPVSQIRSIQSMRGIDEDDPSNSGIRINKKRNRSKRRKPSCDIFNALRIYILITLIGPLPRLSFDIVEAQQGRDKKKKKTPEPTAPPSSSAPEFVVLSVLEEELESMITSPSPSQVVKLELSPNKADMMETQIAEPELTITEKLELARKSSQPSHYPSIEPINDTIISPPSLSVDPSASENTRNTPSESLSLAPSILPSNLSTATSENLTSLNQSSVILDIQSNFSSNITSNISINSDQSLSPVPSFKFSESPSTSMYPSCFPTFTESNGPTQYPTTIISSDPTTFPTKNPSAAPSDAPTLFATSASTMIKSISCATNTENTINVQHQLDYTYTIETKDDAIVVSMQNVISSIEHSLLVNLAHDVLPCDFKLVNTDRRSKDGQDRRLHGRSLNDYIRQIQAVENGRNEDNLTLSSISSDPPDQISSKCSPEYDLSNSCRFIEGSLTITLDYRLNLSNVESILLFKINKFLVSLAHTNNVPGLVGASFYDPFSDEALGIKDHQDNLPKNLATKRKHLREILTYSAVIILCFSLAAMAIFSQQYRYSSSMKKTNISDAVRELNSENGTLPSTPPSPSSPQPEDLESRPIKRSTKRHKSRRKPNVRINSVLGNKTNVMRDEDLSVIMEGSNEDGASSCVSSAFGNFSILSVTTESDSEIGRLDSALSPKEEHDLKKANYSEDQIKDLRSFRLLLNRSASGENSALSPSSSSSSSEQSCSAGNQQMPSQIKPEPRQFHRTIGNNNSLPLSLHRMSLATPKTAHKNQNNNGQFV